MKPDLCIYHGNCADGFSAAWVVWKAYDDLSTTDDIEFHPGVYQQDPPDVTDRLVFLVDFSYKRPVLLEMASKATEIIILDHHKSAQEDLVDLPDNIHTVFDMDRSGAMITWDHFFPAQEPPQLLKHVQDRDLWRFELPGTREIQAALFSYPYDFETWDHLMSRDTHYLFEEGEAIERKHHKDVAELLKVTTRRMLIAGYSVPVANLPYTLFSDAAHQLAAGEPFAACYWDTPNGRVFGLRSKDGGVDVSLIAKEYGGGGHKHAAGFTVPYEQAQEMEETPESAQRLPQEMYQDGKQLAEGLEIFGRQLSEYTRDELIAIAAAGWYAETMARQALQEAEDQLKNKPQLIVPSHLQ